jgi:hypothetical protein
MLHILQAFLEVCCKCLFKIFHLFQTYVAASVLSEYYISFTNMLQVFYLNIAYASHTCCKCFVWILHMFHTYVAIICFIYVRHMLHQVFHVASVSWRHHE